jgi:hypothetical protein
MVVLSWAHSAKTGVVWLTVQGDAAEVRVDDDGRAIVVDGTTVRLFSAVHPDVRKVSVSSSGATYALRCAARDVEEEEWPRLTEDKSKTPGVLVKYDWDRWEGMEDDPNEGAVYGAHNRADAQGLLNHISSQMDGGRRSSATLR